MVPIYSQQIPNIFTPIPGRSRARSLTGTRQSAQIAKGTWSQAQPFLLSAWCFKLFQGYGKRTDITKSSKIHENHGILSLRIGDSWWFNSCFNGRYSPGFTLRFHAAPWDARARSCQRDPKPRFPPEVAGDAMNLWRSKSWGNQLLYFIYTRCKPIYVLYLLLVYLKINYGCEIVLGFFFWAGLGFFFDFLAGTICLVFATAWNLNLSFCMVFATFGHVHLPFCMGFTTCGHVHLPFCMVFATFWHVHLPFCMGFPTCGHNHLPFCMVFATFWHVHLPFLHGMFYMWACPPKYLQMRKLGIR